MRSYEIAMDVVGGAGVAIGSGRRGIPHGILRAVGVKYNGQPGTCDVVLTCVLAGVTKTILTLTDNATDFGPSVVCEAGKDNAGADIVAGRDKEYVMPIVGGELVGAVAQGDAQTDGVKIICLIDTF